MRGGVEHAAARRYHVAVERGSRESDRGRCNCSFDGFLYDVFPDILARFGTGALHGVGM